MATTKEIDYLDGEITVLENVPSTVEELTSMLGEDAVVDETVSNLYYRNKYPRVYKTVSAEIAPSFKRAVTDTKVSTTGIKKEVLESVNDHLRRFWDGEAAEAGAPKLEGDDLVARKAQLTEIFNRVGQEQPLYLKGERSGGGGKISADALANANKFFAAGTANVEKAVSIIESKVQGFKVGRDTEDAVTPESLARGLMAMTKHLAKVAADQMKAEMAGIA